MFSHSCNGTHIFIPWKMKCTIKLGFASLNGTCTFHLSPHENICTIALINIHYLYTILIMYKSSPYNFSQTCYLGKSSESTLRATGTCRGGGHLYFRLAIILVKGLSKHILNTYFSGMKINPKYAFFHAFFLICVSCPNFQNLSITPKTYPFVKFCTFLHP